MIGIGLLVIGMGAFAGSFLCTLLVTGYGVAQLNKRLLSLENGAKSVLGIAAKQQKAEEMDVLMLEASSIWADENVPKEEKMQKMLAIAMKNPTAAGKILKKFGLGDLF